MDYRAWDSLHSIIHGKTNFVIGHSISNRVCQPGQLPTHVSFSLADFILQHNTAMKNGLGIKEPIHVAS